MFLGRTWDCNSGTLENSCSQSDGEWPNLWSEYSWRNRCWKPCCCKGVHKRKSRCFDMDTMDTVCFFGIMAHGRPMAFENSVHKIRTVCVLFLLFSLWLGCPRCRIDYPKGPGKDRKEMEVCQNDRLNFGTWKDLQLSMSCFCMCKQKQQLLVCGFHVVS